MLIPENARHINRRILFIASIFAFNGFLVIAVIGKPGATGTPLLQVSEELISVLTLLFNSLIALGIIALIQGRVWQMEAPTIEPKPSATTEDTVSVENRFWIVIRWLIGILAVASIVAVIPGYARLSNYLLKALLISIIIIGVLFILRSLLVELISLALHSRMVKQVFNISQGTIHALSFWFRALLDLISLSAGLLLIVSVWGVPLDVVWWWTETVFSGFTVGSVTISLTDIALALLTLLATIAITRLLQRTLLKKVLPETRLDASVQHSITAGIGYAGIILAVSLSIAVLGADMANIALIAGALSVGIGFGLQNVVNNFVSGLILLFERPIKVGDWVIVGTNEGFVKDIHIRATELETFQRASVIIPNADLLSTAVTNWTHKDSWGRIEIRVGIAYGSDV